MTVSLLGELGREFESAAVALNARKDPRMDDGPKD